MPQIRVLDVGSGANSIAEDVFEGRDDVEIVKADIDTGVAPDVVWDIRTEPPEELVGQFDIIYAAHVLQYIERNNIVDAIRHIAATARNMAELWFIVPSLEFVVRQLARSNDSPATQVMLHGQQDSEREFYSTSFSLNALRYTVELTGLIVRKAYGAPYTVEAYGQTFPCQQNVIIALKVAQDPAGAIG